MRNYEAFLDKAAISGRKNPNKMGATTAFMMFSFWGEIIFVFFLGGYFFYIERENPSTNKPYTGGNIFNIYCCILIGFMCLGQMPPFLKQV